MHFQNQRTAIRMGKKWKQTWGHARSHCAKAGDYIFLGACGWSWPLRLIKNGLDIKGSLPFNLFCRDQTQCHRWGRSQWPKAGHSSFLKTGNQAKWRPGSSFSPLKRLLKLQSFCSKEFQVAVGGGAEPIKPRITCVKETHLHFIHCRVFS